MRVSPARVAVPQHTGPGLCPRGLRRLCPRLLPRLLPPRPREAVQSSGRGYTQSSRCVRYSSRRSERAACPLHGPVKNR